MPSPASVVRLRRFLRVLAAVFLAAALLYGLGPFLGALPLAGGELAGLESFFGELPFVSNSVVKVVLLGLCCLYAAGDPTGRHGLVKVVIAGHLVSVAAMLVLIVTGTAGGPVPGLPWGETTVLWAAVGLDGAITLILLAFYLAALPDLRAAEGRRPEPDEGPLAGPERLLRGVLYVLGAGFALAAAAYEAGPMAAATAGYFGELPFVTNSVVKVALLAMVCVWVARDFRARLGVMYLPIAAHVVSAAVLLLYLPAAPGGTADLGLLSTGHGTLLAGAAGLDLAIFVLLLVLTQRAWFARDDLQFLRPIEYRTLVALADVLIEGEEEVVPPGDVAANVDSYLSRVRSERRRFHRWALFTMWLHPLVAGFRAPFSELDADQRLRHIRRQFLRKAEPRPLPERDDPPPPLALLRRAAAWVRDRAPIVVRVAQQLSYVGYYNDERTHEAVGYVPFSERPRYGTLPIPDREPHRLDVTEPPDVGGDEMEADVCIVGSGAAGAVLAYYLAGRGRDVLVLEKGRYVEPRSFSEDEMEMMGKLYADGMFQQTDDFDFTILQGSCVGGSTVVNNAVSFDPPEPVLARWNDPQRHDAGLDLPTLRDSVDEVSRLLSITRQTDTRLNPSADLFAEGVKSLGLDEEMELDVVRANLKDCLGCGYCNIGCAYGRKLSMLDTVLPWAQARQRGEVRIVAECEVERLVPRTGPVSTVDHLRATLSDGRSLTVRARDYVLAAGAVATPYLLLRSGIGRDLPVGEKASFNMGSQLTAEFDRKLDAYDGLQISHYLEPPTGRGWVMETWFNPPVAQALNMPGWFGEHFRNMRAYDRMMAVGLLVGTEGNARVGSSLLGGPAVHYQPTVDDLRTLADGLKTLGRILFEAGAERVLLNAWRQEEFGDPSELERLDRVALDPDYLTLGTGHPQGGCAVSRDPRKGVVGPDFRVHGYGNLHVCDASVIPSSLTVNPQLTIMGLARYAADAIR